MARPNFIPSLKFTLAFEGGFANHPKDPGGATMKGITLTTLRRYKKNATVTDLKNISDSLVQQIYRDGYWDEAKCDGLAAGVDGAVFDYAVNSGPGAARKSLTAVLGGPAHETVKRLCARRLSIYRTFKHWKSFGKGWTRRVTAGEALWVKWALAAGADDPAVKQKLDDEAGAAAKKSKQQGGGAVATGGGGAVVSPEAADQVAGLVLTGCIVVAVALVAFLLWRAHLNKQRSKAYAAEAAAI